MNLRNRIVQQFREPRGALGHLAGWIMANRPSNKQRNLWTLDLLNLQPGDQALELGFGPGYAIAEATPRVAHGKVYGIDHSATMLAQANARNAEAIHRERVELHMGEIGDFAWLPSPVDKIWSNNVVQFLPDLAVAFTALRDILRPDGTIASTYQPRHRGATAADSDRMATKIEQALRACGFTDIRTERLSLEPPVVCVLARRPADH